MSRFLYPTLAAFACLLIVETRATFGQFTIVDSNRNVSCSATGTVNNSPAGTQQSPDASSSATGTFNQSNSAAKTDIVGTGMNMVQWNTHSSSSQNSSVSASGFSSSATTAVNTDMATEGAISAGGCTADSSYIVDFTVAAPTQISLTGTYGSVSGQHEGPFSTVTRTAKLTSPSSTLYDISFSGQIGDFGGATNGSSPIPSFNTILQPGITYTLDMDINNNFPATDVTTPDPESQSLSFNVTGVVVPEPASISLLAGAALTTLLRPKRRGGLTR
jgi:hypothetical protein